MRVKRELMVYFLSFTLLLGLFPATSVSAAKKVSLSNKKITIAKGKSKTIKVKNTKKKVKWKIISGKKYITLKKKGKAAATIKGRKKGKAKVRATVGKKKLTCTVTVKDRGKENISKTDKTTSSGSSANTPQTGATTPPGNVSTDKNEQDVVALKALIAEQRGRGAKVSEDIDYTDEYKWENGKLMAICWTAKDLCGNLDVSGLKSLLELDCSFNQLSGLDVSKNTSLTYLNCCESQLNSLDVSKNTLLTNLHCDGNQLTNLDVSRNTLLTELWCGLNQLTNLDVSKNTLLEYLDCGSSELSSLDVSKNTLLTDLWCGFNQLTNLDVSKNTLLTDLWCIDNQLSNLDVSKNTALIVLHCVSNQLTALDLTNNTELTELKCDANVTVTGYTPNSSEE